MTVVTRKMKHNNLLQSNLPSSKIKNDDQNRWNRKRERERDRGPPKIKREAKNLQGMNMKTKPHLIKYAIQGI